MEQFKEDIEGFSYPVVDKETCIDCHLCEKACPIINVEKLKKNDFEEEHTGLADALIETQILARCLKSHKSINKKINRACWRIPQKVAPVVA